MPRPAMRPLNGDIERVRDATDIVRLIGEHVALKPRGREYVGLCPFHDDHSPSMNVVPHKQIFHCFVCGAGGDAIAFMRKFLRVEFREALEMLAERGGVTLSRRSEPEALPSGVTRQDMQKAAAFGADFFRAILNHDEHGRAARDLVSRRGMSPDVVEAFGVGAAPARWDGLLLAIRSKGLDPAPFVEAGLLKRRESDGGLYDAFRHRLMFPIRDGAGRVIAFGGRRVNDEDEPKYLNSSDSRLFAKSATLFGLSNASRGIQATRTVIITEGYLDAIACHQAGITNAVATLGTALTREHASVLRRLCDTVVLVFDGDEAGLRASDRAVEVFFGEPMDVRVATLAGATDAKDPDELLKREGGREVMEAVAANAVDVFEFRYARLRARLEGAGPAAMSRAIDEEIKRLVELGLSELRPVHRERIVSHLARIAGVDRETIVRSIPAGRAGRSRAEEPRPESGGMDRRPLHWREHLLGCVLVEPELLRGPEGRVIEPEAYSAPHMAEVARAVVEAAEGGAWSLRSVLTALEDSEAGQVAVALSERVERECAGDGARLRAGFDESVIQLRRERAKAGGDSPAGDLHDALRHVRRVHEVGGGDRRSLPRPRQR